MRGKGVFFSFFLLYCVFKEFIEWKQLLRPSASNTVGRYSKEKWWTLSKSSPENINTDLLDATSASEWLTSSETQSSTRNWTWSYQGGFSSGFLQIFFITYLTAAGGFAHDSDSVCVFASGRLTVVFGMGPRNCIAAWNSRCASWTGLYFCHPDGKHHPVPAKTQCVSVFFITSP